MERTPPKCQSFTDLTKLTSYTTHNFRKRKQPDDNADSISSLINQSLKTQSTIENLASTQSTMVAELTKISATLANINTSITGLQTDNVSIKESINTMNDRISEMSVSLMATNERQDSFDSRLRVLETQVSRDHDLSDQMLILENKLASMEQQARECNVEISNLPERRDENLVGLTIDIGKLLSQKILPTEIISAHRVPHANQKDERPRNVIVKLSTKILRDNLISQYRAKKGITTEQLSIAGTSRKIYLNEHLTLKNKQLFRETRQKAKELDFKHVWVKHGIILARKTDTSAVIAIRSLHDINKLKS